MRASHRSVVELLEVDVEVCPDAIHSAWQCDTADQEHEQHHIGHRGCDVDHLQRHMRACDKAVVSSFVVS